MTHLTPENLRITLRVARERPTWQEIMASIGASEGLAFHWAKLSKADADKKLGRESKFFVEFEGVWDYWAPGHLNRAKSAFVNGFERKILDACANDYTEVATCPQSGRPLQKILPQFAHYSRERCIAEGLDPDIDIFEWAHDPISGELIQPLQPVYLTKVVRSSAMLKLRGLSSQINAWSERTTNEHVVSGHVAVVHVAPPRFVPKAIREQQGEIVDASFTEVPAARKDITELRALAHRHLSNPDRITRPDSPVLDATGHPLGRPREQFRPDHEDGAGAEDQPAMTVASDTPKPKVAVRPGIPQPTNPPPYARRNLTDPHAPGARAMPANKVIR